MHARSCTLYIHAPIQLYYVHNYAMYIMKISESMASLLAALWNGSDGFEQDGETRLKRFLPYYNRVRGPTACSEHK